MAKQNQLLMRLLRLITPEEISEIVVKHNEGGRFISLTVLVRERVLGRVYRDFQSFEVLEEAHQSHEKGNQVLAFEPSRDDENQQNPKEKIEVRLATKFKSQMINTSQIKDDQAYIELNAHQKELPIEEKNMSAFILEEKERLRKSQSILKKIEVVELYSKNSHLNSEDIKTENKSKSESSQKGNLVNKKQ